MTRDISLTSALGNLKRHLLVFNRHDQTFEPDLLHGPCIWVLFNQTCDIVNPISFTKRFHWGSCEKRHIFSSAALSLTLYHVPVKVQQSRRTYPKRLYTIHAEIPANSTLNIRWLVHSQKTMHMGTASLLPFKSPKPMNLVTEWLVLSTYDIFKETLETAEEMTGGDIWKRIQQAVSHGQMHIFCVFQR